MWLSQNCCLVLHTNFISCRVSFVLRCFYKGTLVVCAVARTVSRFVQRSFDLHGSFGFIQISPSTPSTRSKIQKKYFGFTHAHLKFISAPRKDKHFIGQLWQLMTASNVGAWTHAWQAKWAVFKIEMFVCKRFLPFFLTPSPLFYLRNFYPRSLTLVPRSSLVNRTETLATRYISIHMMYYYVCDNMAAYENSLLCILFGLLLSILFCNDGHHEVLSKDFIYGCLVRNRKLDPSMGDNFKCFYLNARYHYRRKQFSRKFKVAIPISKTTGHRFITLAPPHSLFSMDLSVCMDVHCNPGALTRWKCSGKT